MFELKKHGEVYRWSVSIVGKKFNHGICSTGGYLVCAQFAMVKLRREVQLIIVHTKMVDGKLLCARKKPDGKERQ